MIRTIPNQRIIQITDGILKLDDCFINNHIRKILLVCGKSIQHLKVNGYFQSLEQRLGIRVVRFSAFTPNPNYDSIVNGVEMFHLEGCDAIVAVGGGSAMDVAKCIKLFANMKESENYLKQTIVPNDILLYAMPTTAGTGSEATKFAVIYYNGIKQSVTHDSCIPSVVFMDASTLQTLPIYQKKVTMLDALCHATESFWSINSTDESKKYAELAIELILDNIDAYLSNLENGNQSMLLAANYAGRAINITQTTAAHAMCYKLTSLYGIPHGHAVALCLLRLWPYMINNIQQCCDKRGRDYLDSIFLQLARLYKCETPMGAACMFQDIIIKLGLTIPDVHEQDYDILKSSVNPIRLKNNPIALDSNTIDFLYHQILEGDV